MTIEELKEDIAKILCKLCKEGDDAVFWEDCYNDSLCHECVLSKSAILALPDIKRGLELLESCRYEDGFEAAMSRDSVKRGLELVELEKTGKLVMLAEDQEWPLTPYRRQGRLRPREFDFRAAVNEGFSRSKTVARAAGFKRVTKPIKGD